MQGCSDTVLEAYERERLDTMLQAFSKPGCRRVGRCWMIWRLNEMRTRTKMKRLDWKYSEIRKLEYRVYT